MGEMEERPDIAPCVAHGVKQSAEELRTYMRRLAESGFVDWTEPDADEAPRQPGPSASRRASGGEPPPRAEDAYAAGTMLMAALFSDAMGREMVPGMYPEPAEQAPALYVRLFLRAVRCARAPRRRARPTLQQARS
jgi:hypothetical protein